MYEFRCCKKFFWGLISNEYYLCEIIEKRLFEIILKKKLHYLFVNQRRLLQGINYVRKL